MINLRTLSTTSLSACVLLVAPALAGEIVVPNNAPTTAGNGGYSTLMHAQERSYQLVVGPQELGGLPVGALITGITWRRPSWIAYPDWPGIGSVASYANYDIYLSTSNNPPGSLSTTYTDNIGPDVVQVRGGPLTLSGAHFPGGALTPSVNPFGVVIPFATSYAYKGGDLLLTIRHTGNSSSSGFLDTVSSPYYQAIGVSSYTQPDNWYNQGLITMKLVFDDSAASFCAQSKPTTVPGCTPTLSATDFSLATGTWNVGNVPLGPAAGGTSVGIFIYQNGVGLPQSTFSASVPFGDLCLNPFLRSAPACAAVTIAGGGINVCHPGFAPFSPDCNGGALGIQVGDSVNAQAWYRDPGAAGNANFTNAIYYTVQ